MCWFCEKIYDTEELYNTPWWEMDGVNYITFNKKYVTYNYWHNCSDSYYSGEIMEISYCPKCGRKLDD